jgi:aspartate carbamoyltransferase catalytic subunit
MENDKPRSVITIDDLSLQEINSIFDLADQFLEGNAWRVRGRRDLANQHILSTLFYEPSTRTRFSFESAMLRLGGHILSSADPASTSSVKGETIADTVRVVENYADIIVIRHPWEGAARVAEEFTSVPIINAGDGAHEHPTQTLCDLYTLRREKKRLKDLNVLICGDLKNGRTVHSLVYALARFGADIHIKAAPGFGLPEHVSDRLKNKYGFEPDETSGANVDAVYRAPDQQSSFMLVDFHVQQHAERSRSERGKHFDVCYVTRLQMERLEGDHVGQYPVVNGKFLKKKEYAHSSVLHPLPRVDELGYDLDIDPRAVYFKQASYGVPIRMALIRALLELNFCFARDPKWNPYNYEKYSNALGVHCEWSRCITNHEAEKRHLKPKFWIVVEHDPVTLRCVYCEHEVKPQCVGNLGLKKLAKSAEYKSIEPKDRVFFLNASDARGHGFHYPRATAKEHTAA